MRVLLPESLFAEPAIQAELLALVMMAHLQWPHRLIIEEDGSGAFQTWLQALSVTLREELELSREEWELEEAAPDTQSTPRNTLVLKAAGAADWGRFPNHPVQVSVTLAVTVLNRPFEIILENARTDRAFVLAISRPEWRDRLTRWETEGWLRFVHGGGFPQLGTDARVQLTRREAGETRIMIRRMRSWFIFDSDRLRPAAQPASGADQPGALLRLCNSLGVGVWCLQRRFIESYLPPRKVEEWADSNGKRTEFDAWSSLSRERRRYANLKRGIKRDLARPRLSREDRDYWQAVDAAVREQFGDGFSDRLGKSWLQAVDGGWTFDADAQREADGALAQLIDAL